MDSKAGKTDLPILNCVRRKIVNNSESNVDAEKVQANKIELVEELPFS